MIAGSIECLKVNAMAERTVRNPGVDHPITIAPTRGRVTVRSAGRVIADTIHALSLKEGGYPVVQYVPRKDVDMSLLERTDHATYCPYKGDCSYYSIPSGGAYATNAAWSYENPYDAVIAIKDYLAFYPNRVDSIEIVPA